MERLIRHGCLFVMVVCVLQAFSPAAYAAVPTTINHQGYLTNASGQPVDGAVSMVFTLYKADNSQVWTETQSSVQVTKGVYSVLLGSVMSLAALPFDVQYFLGIKVGSDQEMSPRQALASTAYSFRAAKADSLAYTGAIYRWATFDTYDQSFWMAQNNPALYGGVNPSNWTDNNANAAQISADKSVLRTLFTNKGYGGKNALIVSHVYLQYSSTNGRVTVVLMRIRNSTASQISWTPYFYFTSCASWSERASVALNGTSIYSASGDYASAQAGVSMLIPANRVSTVIFAIPSGPPVTGPGGFFVRSNLFAFYNDSLQLPAGLEYVDDLDTATGGWEQ